jgi:uncharacterized membrane protein YqiK
VKADSLIFVCETNLPLQAVEQFGDRDKATIMNDLSESLEGHLRAILGTMTVEEIYTEREQFAKAVVGTVGDPFSAQSSISCLAWCCS